MRLKDKELEFLPSFATEMTFYDVKDITDGYQCTQLSKSLNMFKIAFQLYAQYAKNKI